MFIVTKKMLLIESFVELPRCRQKQFCSATKELVFLIPKLCTFLARDGLFCMLSP